ncbi:MAG: lipopolysaccharide transport periplasmic protein LptA, partial [Burkholderiales bacterium]|nr:lipopolysaccharide transport periplasmic protein LptA [Burkholderiales bacterium]
GKKASFRQKSDNGDDEWIEGEGARIEYSDQTEEMKIFAKARLKRLQGSKVMEDVEGEAIVYDSLKEVFSANNTPNGTNTPGGNRIKVVIQSKDGVASTASSASNPSPTTPATPNAMSTPKK